MRRYSTSERASILDRLATSGLSRAAFCRREGLCYATVSAWLTRERRSERSSSLSLVEVSAEDPARSVAGGVTVALPSGLEVRFGESTPLATVADFCREVAPC